MAVGERCLVNQEEIMQQLQAAVQAYQSKNLDGAEAIFKQILAFNPKEPNALHLLGCIYKDRGQLQQAVHIRGELCEIQDLHRRRNFKAGVAQRQTDGFFSDVEPQQLFHG